MYRLSDNYYSRKCYLEGEQAPTQSVMKDRMNAPLAKVYFKSMSPKLKVVAGLEPQMKGGGTEWYMPPEDILAGRPVLRPVKREHLLKLGFYGLFEIGEKLRERHFKEMIEEKRQAMIRSDNNWKQIVKETIRDQYAIDAKMEIAGNSKTIRKTFNQFEILYRKSINTLETMIFEAAIAEIKRIRAETFQGMKERYAEFIKYQSTQLYEEYDDRLRKTKESIKQKFIKQVQELRTGMTYLYHDIKVEKYIVLEKLRQMLHCQNLACQIYVGLKEREECEKEIETSKQYHAKKVKELKEDIAIKDYEIHEQIKQHQQRQEFQRVWRQKVCHVVKKFQIFVEYCLRKLPQHADFFLDMEKLMLLQLNEAAENPFSESIIDTSEPRLDSPIARPHPYYLFSEQGYKPRNIEQNLCPKHCTSSASQMPVVVVNKRYIYSACDNLELFTDKVVHYIAGLGGDDTDFDDDHNYEPNKKVKCASSNNLDDLPLESSIMQIVDHEMTNRKNLPVKCVACGMPYCFCSPLRASREAFQLPKPEIKQTVSITVEHPLTRSAELRLLREPKWKSYYDYVMPKKCKCSKMVKKHLETHMPSYMGQASPFEPPELPNYETCPPHVLRELVRRAKGVRPPTPPPPELISNTKDVGTQYTDQEYDSLCDCFSDDAIKELCDTLIKGSKMFAAADNRCIILDGSRTPSYLTKSVHSFATQRAFSLRNLIGEIPELEQIFKRNDCDIEK